MKVFIFILTYLACVCLNDTTSVTVSTLVGDIEGFEDSVLVDGQKKVLTKFLGIPYAESTAGNQRFRKPVPKAPFKNTFSAKTYSPSCFQSPTSRGVDPTKFTEDCLFLNVFVPNDFQSNATLPVMIWIHGGAFVSGTASLYPGDVFSTFGNVVLVTINYRLEMFGFLRSADGQLVGNQGLWDQQLAIQWVHKNIDSFHGNPDEITIFGESAGSASVLFQALYPGNKGLFKRVIAESGSSLSYWATMPTPNADEFINKANCSHSGLDPYTCIRFKPAAELQAAQVKFRPFVDGDFVVEHPYDIVYGNNPKSAAARELFASLDILHGTNNQDGALYLISVWPVVLKVQDFNHLNLTRERFDNICIPAVVGTVIEPKSNNSEVYDSALIFEYTDWSDPDNVDNIRQSLVNLSSDIAFFTSTIQTVQGHSNLSRRSTYLYEFALTPTYHTLPAPTWVTGSSHADEIPFVFGEPLSPINPSRANFTTEEAVVSKAIITMWTNFAKSSNPNMPMDIKQYIQTTWPEYDSVSQSFMKFSNKLSSVSIGQYFYAKRMSFWLDFIPSLANTPQMQAQLQYLSGQ